MSKYAISKAFATGLSYGHTFSGFIVLAITWAAPADARPWLLFAALPMLVASIGWLLLRTAFAWAEKSEEPR